MESIPEDSCAYHSGLPLSTQTCAAFAISLPLDRKNVSHFAILPATHPPSFSDEMLIFGARSRKIF